MMLLLILILLTMLLGLAGLYLAERISLPTATEDRTENHYAPLASGFTSQDVQRVRFSTSLRGYRMTEVDELVDQLQERICQQERQLAELKARPDDAQQVL